jgi:predicted XRE-type DNA-binding protein
MSGESERGTVTVSIEKSEFKDLIRVINDLVKVFAAAQIKPDQGTEKNARFLRVFGLSQQEIADLLGVTQPTVNEALSKGKKKQKGREAKHDTGESAPG